jgi:general secretion pathway protein A
MDILAYFHLNERPFRISPDPRFLFLSDQVKEALAKVQYMTRERIGPLIYSGPIGSGKTSIMRRLYEQLHEEPSYNIVLIIAPNVKTSNAFLRMVMDGFRVKTDRSYARCLKNFEDFLIEQYKASTVPVLLVDEGQNMTRDILRLVHYLLNFETSSVKLLQIVLAGQEQLTEKILRYPELASRMFPIAMNAMSATELRAMIEFRYMVAGGKQVPFTDEAYKEIFIYSKGLPRDAVKVCDETLRHLFVRQQQQADATDITEVAATLNLKK